MSKDTTNKQKRMQAREWGKYKGSIVMAVDDHVYATKNPKNVNKMLREIEKKHHKKPVITVVPKADLLIYSQNLVA